MDIIGKKVLILGGWGLVGMAVIRQIAKHQPKEFVIISLKEDEAKSACDQLSKEFPKIGFTPEWGNIFVRRSLKDLGRDELMNNAIYRTQILEDVMEGLDEEKLKSSSINYLISKHKPHVIIDSVNSATGLAYQDIYTGYYNLKKEMKNAKKSNELTENLTVEVEKMLSTLYIPQIIRHIQILHASMVDYDTKAYIKIGTTGTGGMGLNIPYTHSEEKPSRVLLSKTSLAGAHSLLLFLAGRTPDGPIVKEIKPAAAIAWKGIKYGEIKKHGKAVKLFDCSLENAVELSDSYDFKGHEKWQDKGDTLKSIYIDTGENGIFSRGEFEAITTAGQMEFVTPEEIADNVVLELMGGNTGSDIVNALDNAVMGPTYRAGYLRHHAIEQMKQLEKENNVKSVAFEILGPPRLSKLLYEAQLLRIVCDSVNGIHHKTAKELSELLQKEILSNDTLRVQTISVGIPILLNDGKKLLRGPSVKIPVQLGKSIINLDSEKKDKWANAGWIDLRESNMKLWKSRINDIVNYVNGLPIEDNSSRFDHGIEYWKINEPVNIGKLASWIFIEEDKGLRIKR
jgi:hypothetical protein